MGVVSREKRIIVGIIRRIFGMRRDMRFMNIDINTF